jgi:hypothetical protein
VALNFLHVNNENYSIIVFFSKIVVVITISKKLVKMGRKSCLFLYHVKLIGIKLWMAKEGVTLNGGLESRMAKNNIRRIIRKQCKHVFFSFMISFKRW